MTNKFIVQSAAANMPSSCWGRALAEAKALAAKLNGGICEP